MRIKLSLALSTLLLITCLAAGKPHFGAIIMQPQQAAAQLYSLPDGKNLGSIGISGHDPNAPLSMHANALGQILFLQVQPDKTQVWFWDGKQAKNLRSSSIHSEAKQPLSMALDARGQGLYWFENIDTLGSQSRELKGQVDAEGYTIVETVPTIKRRFRVSFSNLAGQQTQLIYQHDFPLCWCEQGKCQEHCAEGSAVLDRAIVADQLELQMQDPKTASQTILLQRQGNKWQKSASAAPKKINASAPVPLPAGEFIGWLQPPHYLHWREGHLLLIDKQSGSEKLLPLQSDRPQHVMIYRY